MEAAEIVALIIVGLLAGSAAASVMEIRWIRRRIRTRRWAYYAVVGVLGALVGQLLFSALGINVPELLSGEIEVADIVMAFVGAIIVIFVAEYFRL